MDGKELRRRYYTLLFFRNAHIHPYIEVEPDCIDSYKAAAGEDRRRRGPCGPRALAACEAHATASSIFFLKGGSLTCIPSYFF